MATAVVVESGDLHARAATTTGTTTTSSGTTVTSRVGATDDPAFVAAAACASSSPSASSHTQAQAQTQAAQVQACCDAFARRCFPSRAAALAGQIRPAPSQGFCSYTLFVGDDTVLQFRPGEHLLDVEMCALARDVYGEALVPRTTSVGTTTVAVSDEGSSSSSQQMTMTTMHAFAMSRIKGVSLADFRRRVGHHHSSLLSLGDDDDNCADWRRQHQGRGKVQEQLVRDFAAFVAQGWRHATTAITTMTTTTAGAAHRPARLCQPGRIGSSLRWRLELLRDDGLPARFQPVVERVLASLPDIEGILPWVLTHGDVVPGNVMVLPSSSAVGGDGGGTAAAPRLSGLLDWAEAEYLPFGVGLYGLEELLGESSSPASAAGPLAAHYPAPGSTFVYYREAPALRAAFWAELESAIPELRRRRDDGGGSAARGLRELVEMARLLGILLWHGIAFDGGRLDRVVREGVGGIDAAEVQRLDLFLLGRAGCADADSEADDVQHGTIDDDEDMAIDPDGAILEDVLDEDDVDEQQQQQHHESPTPSSSPASGSDPGFTPVSSRRQSIGDAARRAWNYMRRLQFPGKL